MSGAPLLGLRWARVPGVHYPDAAVAAARARALGVPAPSGPRQPAPRREITPARLAEIAATYAATGNILVVCRRHGCGVMTAYRAIERAGMTVKRCGQRGPVAG